MAAHYRIVRQHGIHRARDGLREAGLDVIGDLNHFDPPDDPVAHARRVAKAADPNSPLWICPVNEPSVYPMLCGMPCDAAVDLFIKLTKNIRDYHPHVCVMTTDPIVGIGDRQYGATDALVAAGLVDVVGVNYYPHTARTALSKVLIKTARRYGKTMMVAETSWHAGHPVHRRLHPGRNKGDPMEAPAFKSKMVARPDPQGSQRRSLLERCLSQACSGNGSADLRLSLGSLSGSTGLGATGTVSPELSEGEPRAMCSNSWVDRNVAFRL